MIIIHPNGTTESVPYSYEALSLAVNPGGTDDAFDSVPLPESLAGGYSVYVNDCGLLNGMPRNLLAESLCKYSPLHGPAVVASYEEAGEEELLTMVLGVSKRAFEARLKQVVERATSPS